MPENDPGKLTPSQAADLVAHLLEVGKFPSGRTELGADEKALSAIVLPATRPQAILPAASPAPTFPAIGNLAQVMRGILFPSSNIIFNVQTNDPAAPGQVGTGASAAFSWVDWGAGIYKGWEIVDNAAVSVAESAPLMLTPGRRCENGRPVPVDKPDWIKFSQELAEAGRAAYKASQTRSQEAVSDATNQLSDACLHCHMVYRDKPGGNVGDPSNKAARWYAVDRTGTIPHILKGLSERTTSQTVRGSCCQEGVRPHFQSVAQALVVSFAVIFR